MYIRNTDFRKEATVSTQGQSDKIILRNVVIEDDRLIVSIFCIPHFL